MIFAACGNKGAVMTANCRPLHIGTLLVTLGSFLLSGCASMISSKEELQNIGDNEGIVVGSVLLTVAQRNENERWVLARKSRDLDYSLAVSQTGFNPLKPTYTLSATPDKEEFFVKTLPAGNYEIDRIDVTGFFVPNGLKFPLGLEFTVTPKKIIYLGRISVTAPYRIVTDSGFRLVIQNAEQETIEALRKDYPSIVTNLAVDLLSKADEGPRVVPGNTVASPVLQRDTLSIINAVDGAVDMTCDKRTVVNTETIKMPTRPDDTIHERWTVDRCGKTITYRVTFTPSARGGTDISAMQEK
jgi:hypothetical protein